MNDSDSDSELDGEGLLDMFKRKAGVYPPEMRKVLEKIGNDNILGIDVFRKPLQSFISKALKIASFGKSDQALKELNYDELFHLGLVIHATNSIYTLEKEQVLVMKEWKQKPDMEIRTVCGPIKKTVNELVEKTKEYMGDKAFSSYNFKNNNCQVFCVSVLRANGLSRPDLEKFILQDIVTIAQTLHPVANKAADAIVSHIAPIADKIMNGHGLDNVTEYKRESEEPKITRRMRKELLEDETIRNNPKLSAKQKLLLQIAKKNK